MDSTCLYPYGIAITEWFQGIGGLVAIIAVLIALFQLFKKDKSKQSQIDSIKELVEKQDDIIGKMNEEIKLQNKIVNLEQTKRKSNIKPYFQYSDYGAYETGVRIRLKNVGLRAFNVYAGKCYINEYESESVKTNIVDTNDIYQVIMKNPKGNHLSTVSTFDLFFEDIDGNEYRQLITWKDYTAYADKPQDIE